LRLCRLFIDAGKCRRADSRVQGEFAGAGQGQALFRGNVTKPGRTIIVADGQAYAFGADGEAKLIATMTGTMMTVTGRQGIEGVGAQVETIAGRRVLFVMAAEAEYGPHLRARFKPLMTGVGPVEAAIAVERNWPAWVLPGGCELVVSLGSAGSRMLEQTGVYRRSP
jgi:hypothetical protein